MEFYLNKFSQFYFQHRKHWLINSAHIPIYLWIFLRQCFEIFVNDKFCMFQCRRANLPLLWCHQFNRRYQIILKSPLFSRQSVFQKPSSRFFQNPILVSRNPHPTTLDSPSDPIGILLHQFPVLQLSQSGRPKIIGNYQKSFLFDFVVFYLYNSPVSDKAYLTLFRIPAKVGIFDFYCLLRFSLYSKSSANNISLITLLFLQSTNSLPRWFLAPKT